MKNKGLIGAAALAAVLMVGCGGGSGVLNEPQPRVKVVNGVIGVSTLTAREGQNVITSGLSYGFPTPNYAIVDRGQNSVLFYNAVAPTNSIGSASRLYTFGDRIDIVAYGNPSNSTFSTLQMVDNTANATSGSYRVVNSTVTTGSLDVFFYATAFQPTGVINIASGGVINGTTNTADLSDYASAQIQTATSYTLSIYPAGNDTGQPLATDTLILNPTDRYTFFLIDPPSGGGSYSIVAVKDNNAQ